MEGGPTPEALANGTFHLAGGIVYPVMVIRHSAAYGGQHEGKSFEKAVEWETVEQRTVGSGGRAGSNSGIDRRGRRSHKDRVHKDRSTMAVPH
jgi:hypothetical protein